MSKSKETAKEQGGGAVAPCGGQGKMRESCAARWLALRNRVWFRVAVRQDLKRPKRLRAVRDAAKQLYAVVRDRLDADQTLVLYRLVAALDAAEEAG